MTILARAEIRKLVESGDLLIEPFDEDLLEPASYDCRLGDVLASGEGKVQFEESEDFVLESNSWASISSHEMLTIPRNVCATYGIRSGLARRGVIAFGGPQIDPGYTGRIFISIYNPTLEPIVLRKNQIIFSLILFNISSEDPDGYRGEYQGQRDFPSQDVEFMMRMKSKNLADVIDNVETLDTSVKNLATNLATLTNDVHAIKKMVDDFKPWLKVIAFLLGSAAVAAVGWVVVQLLSSWFS